MLRRTFLSLLACAALFASAEDATQPYDEAADAKADIQKALQQAAKDKQTVLVVFGANWCGDCRALDKTLKAEKSSAVAKQFRVVKVNVGRYDKNQDIAKMYGVPLNKGIPTVALLSPRSDVLYTTQAGELADARKMSDADVFAFFDKLVKAHPVN
ncbi:thioredoxin family protein [Burkholderiaceae bacterium DAT-1]|nr:thioredoxin family protein [Burkholderiaceae bacterium DAT-1]